MATYLVNRGYSGQVKVNGSDNLDVRFRTSDDGDISVSFVEITPVPGTEKDEFGPRYEHQFIAGFNNVTSVVKEGADIQYKVRKYADEDAPRAERQIVESWESTDSND